MLPILKTIICSLFKKSSTIRDFSQKDGENPILRGHIEIEIEKCIFCGICQKKCPTDAIEVKKDESSWAIQRFRCIQCSCCTEVCPKQCLHMDNKLPSVFDNLTEGVAAYARVSDNDADNSNS